MAREQLFLCYKDALNYFFKLGNDESDLQLCEEVLYRIDKINFVF